MIASSSFAARRASRALPGEQPRRAAPPDPCRPPQNDAIASDTESADTSGYAARVTATTSAATASSRDSSIAKCASFPATPSAYSASARSRIARGVARYAASATARPLPGIPKDLARSLVQRPALGLRELGAVRHGAVREVAGGHFGVHLDARVVRDQLVGDRARARRCRCRRCTTASCFMLLIDTKRSIFVMPSQCRTSGIST